MKRFLILLILCCTPLLKGYLKSIDLVTHQFKDSPAFIMFYDKKKLSPKETTGMYGIYVPSFVPPKEPAKGAAPSQGIQSTTSTLPAGQSVQGRRFVQPTVPPQRIRPTDRPVYGPRQTLQGAAQKEPLKPGQYRNILSKPQVMTLVKAAAPTDLAIITSRSFKEVNLQGIDTIAEISINGYGDIKVVAKKGGKNIDL